MAVQQHTTHHACVLTPAPALDPALSPPVFDERHAEARKKLAASGGAANDTAEDASTSRAIAAAIQAHGVCGHLRARVASIQMRLRDRKRELDRAHAFG